MDDELLRLLGRHQREDLDADASEREVPAPYEGAERAALLDDLFARVDAEGENEGSAHEHEPPSAASDRVIELDVHRTRAGPGEETQARSSSRRSLILLTSLATAAAAALLLWWGLGETGEDPLLAQLPSYEISRLQGGVARSRAEPSGERPTVRADSTIDWVFTPAEPIREPLAVALVAVSETGARVFAARVEAEISAEGAIRLRGLLATHIELEPGEWTLRVLVAPPDRLPRDLDQLDDWPTWQTIAFELTIVAGD
ncbi:hypothetical protein ENSA5_52970 [Enhygromyxa salina]|uniref:Uncharacterized protein n=1 Tax=Enhygromyxa salina TaxID=215803 RepID=A0A2S9XFV1_9BACT|nr:hypothetical protein [Enhygromyxa salina]PRP91717.1 hypothetical protein ENSA5_52970 [Enhygromyxa salina]